MTEKQQAQPIPWRLALLVLLFVGLALRLYNALRPLEELIVSTIPDDTFYYFGIARHIALGNPPSIDGFTPTNGFHPLWALLLVPLYSLFGAHELRAPITSALCLGAIIDIIAAWLIWRVLSKLKISNASCLIAVAVFVLNPYQVVNATCGLETPLALVFALALLDTYVNADTDHLGKGCSPWRFGLLGGLVILSRTDHAIVFACLVFGLLWRARRLPRVVLLSWSLITACLALLIVLPWFYYSLDTTGELIQSSGTALTHIYSQLPRTGGLELSTTIRLQQAFSVFLNGFSMLARFHSTTPAVFAAVLFLIFLSFLVHCRRDETSRNVVSQLGPWLLAFVLLFFGHAAGRLVFREWYSAPFIATVALVVGITLHNTAQQLKRPHLLLATAGVGVLIWAVFSTLAWRSTKLYSQQLAGIPNTNTREGHTDCGVVSYFTTQGITNLDGVVNNSAIKALNQGRLLDYIRSQRFDRVYASYYYHSEVFWGSRYREELITDRGDPRAVRLVNGVEDKDNRIVLSEQTVLLGQPNGREHLSDGWLWNSAGGPSVRSVGHASELIFFVPRTYGNLKMEIKLAAIAVNTTGIQPVTVVLNGHNATVLDVMSEETWHEIPLDSARSGRNRLRFNYGITQIQPDPPGYFEGIYRRGIKAAIVAFAIRSRRRPSRKLVIPLEGAPGIVFSGFYGLEENKNQCWRWTNGRGTVKIAQQWFFDGAPSCTINVQVGGEALNFSLLWNGKRLSVEKNGFFGPVAPPETTFAELEIHSSTFVPAELGESGDRRRLGVSIQRIVLDCSERSCHPGSSEVSESTADRQPTKNDCE